MKKRLLPFVLCIILVGVFLVACGGGATLPDGKKLLEDAMGKDNNPDYYTIKADLAFSCYLTSEASFTLSWKQ